MTTTVPSDLRPRSAFSVWLRFRPCYLLLRTGLLWGLGRAVGMAAARWQWRLSLAALLGTGLAATLLFNFTMAITLSELARLLPRARGTAFGIASFSLAIGAFPALMGLRAVSPGALCVLSLVSLASLLGGLAAAERVGRR